MAAELCVEFRITNLLFARDIKQRSATTVPFTYLGSADLEQHESERPIKVVWRLRHGRLSRGRRR